MPQSGFRIEIGGLELVFRKSIGWGRNEIAHRSENSQYPMPQRVPRSGMSPHPGMDKSGIDQLSESSATPAHTRITPAQRTGATFSPRINFAPNAPAT